MRADAVGEPWPAPDARRRKSDAEIARRVRRWRIQRAIERALPAVRTAVIVTMLLAALRILAWRGKAAAELAGLGLVICAGALVLALRAALRWRP